MRLLHTADWHVGKTLKGVSRLDEQEQVLREIVRVAAWSWLPAMTITSAPVPASAVSVRTTSRWAGADGAALS